MPPTPSTTYERLRDYIARRMRMSHIDQPLMLMELLGHGFARNLGGSDDLCNLQALCFRCNTAKRWEAGCVFCALEASGQVLLENELALCIADAYPVTPGHSLVIPRRHGADGLELHQPEWNAVGDAGRRSRNKIRWAGTVRWSAARPQEPAWPASDHGWPASSARNLR